MSDNTNKGYKWNNVKVTVKFDKVLQRDENIVMQGVSGDDLEELNKNARDMIIEYREYNNIDATAEYYLFDVKGSVASTIKSIGRL